MQYSNDLPWLMHLFRIAGPWEQLEGKRLHLTRLFMDGEEASVEKRGYILRAYGIIDIKGWRRTDDDVAAFEFTKTGQSYSAKVEKGTDNVGVIGVAVFDEKVVRHQWTHWTMPMFNDCINTNGPIATSGTLYRSRSSDSVMHSNYASTNSVSKGAQSKSPDFNVGTGYGKETSMKVTKVSFVRESLTPDYMVSCRYASRDRLIKWGVISEPAKIPNPFPGDKVACKAPPNWKG